MTARARAGAALAAVAIACGPVPGAPPPVAPVNACPAHPCAAYAPYTTGGAAAQCDDGYCQVASTLDYTLVVALPDTSYFAPGLTFVVPFSQLFASPTAMCPVGTCSNLPNIAVTSGEYWPLPSAQDEVAQDEVGFDLGAMTVVPSTTTFRPGTLSSDGVTFVESAIVGLPLLSAVADIVPYTTVFQGGGLPGPGGGGDVAFRAELAPGTYERTIMPASPYDAWFPPDVSVVSLAAGTLPAELDELKDIDTINSGSEHNVLTVTREDGAPLDGWTAYLVDATTGRRVSAATSLSNVPPTSTSPYSYDVPLPGNRHLGTGQGFKGAEFLLVPPAGADAIPTLVAPNQAMTILAPPYPMVPAPVTVSGSVTNADGSVPVPATLIISSTQIDSDSPTTNLVYSARVTTTATGDPSSESYQVRLPPGAYDVVVVPSDSASAKLTLPLTVAMDVDPQAGKNLALAAKTPVIGSAIVSDGRALAGAQIEATPAASLGPASLTPTGTSADAWPRAATTTTADDGTFQLALDPGTYDITVRPADGSSLPWVVSPSRQVGATTVVLEPIAVPAPIVAGLTLHDPQDNPVASAIVRVFAVPTGGTAYVEIGRALTDATGHYAMFIAGTPY